MHARDTRTLCRRRWRLVAVLLLGSLATASAAEPAPGPSAASPKRLLLIGQAPDGHPAGTHEYMAGMRLMALLLRDVDGLACEVVQADEPWTDGPELLRRADGAVIFLSQGAQWMDADPRRRQALRELAARGGGLVGLHWGIGTKPAEHVALCLELLGGCHGGPDRKYKVLETRLFPAEPLHPIARGVASLELREEFYYRLKFVPPAGSVTPVVVAPIAGGDETVGWAWERPGGGRSFGFSGGHFHVNWRHAAYRRLMAQAALWTLDLPIPDGGLAVDATDADLDYKPHRAAAIAARGRRKTGP